ncbi:hypothetical protein CEK62_10035 [Alcanivorax sp. N3-2A]|nr:hypothetical protein CEK62_10035 [Alcanivorax sp. N3-2A]|tara:strand:+ start:32170 stop:32844 length:675 start_codon:yes stop_codon:yes gene_type:complete
MTALKLSLYEDTLPAAADPVYLPALARSLFVVQGALSVESDTGAQWLDTGAALVEQSEQTLLAGADGATVWRWELSLADHGASRTLRASPATTSTLKLEQALDLPAGYQWLMRCDRVAFPPGGTAWTHVHQGPGIRCCLNGEISIETEGRSLSYPPGSAWFEKGPEPVLAPTTEQRDTTFIRCFLLPRQLKGRSSIRYVHPEDAQRPKVQAYRVFAERHIQLPQ